LCPATDQGVVGLQQKLGKALGGRIHHILMKKDVNSGLGAKQQQAE
jgi:hypothetical protein